MRIRTAKALILSERRIRHSSQAAYFDAVALTKYHNHALNRWVSKNGWYVIEIVSQLTGDRRFKLLPWRWVVERTFGWLGRCRIHSKDYEHLTDSSEAQIRVSMIQLMLRRLTEAKYRDRFRYKRPRRRTTAWGFWNRLLEVIGSRLIPGDPGGRIGTVQHPLLRGTCLNLKITDLVAHPQPVTQSKLEAPRDPSLAVGGHPPGGGSLVPASLTGLGMVLMFRWPQYRCNRAPAIPS